MPDRADLDLLTQAQRNAVTAATEQLDAFFARAATWSADEVAAGASDLMVALVQRYGDAVATAAAEWYERLRAAEVTGTYEALLADPLPTQQVESTVRALSRGLYGPDADWTQVRSALGGALQRYVAEQARSTIERNALKDKAARRFARVPQGGRTCAFCAMLASRGFAYTSAKAAGEAHAYHDRCDCLVVPAFGDDDPVIDGYDPTALAARYDEARKVVEKSGKPATPQNIAAAMRQLHPEEYTDGAGVRRSGKRKPKEKTDESGSGDGHKPPRGQSTSSAHDDEGPRTRVRASGARVPEGLRVSEHELRTADLLSRSGLDVEMLPVDNTPGRKNPDARLDGEVWEFKAPLGSSERNTIADQFKRAGRQASRLVLDLRRCGLDDQTAIEQAERRFFGRQTLREMIIIDHAGEIYRYRQQ